MKLIDTHVHLDHLENLDEEMRLAREAGVEAIVAMSVGVDSSLQTLAISRQIKALKVFVACGIHPSEADVSKMDECERIIREHRSGLCAVGEVGLDFWYKWVREDDAKKDDQKKVFRRMCELAHELNLPMTIHSRGAQKHCLEILQECRVPKAVFHWYDASVKVLKHILDAGYLISATPNLAYNQAAREAVDFAPVDRVLIETDSPVKFFNKHTNEEFQAGPKDVARTLKALAALKNMDEEEAACLVNRNAVEFFGLDIL